MKRFISILAALTCVASAQTYITVTANTNGVIRTNFAVPFNSVQSIGSAASYSAGAFQPSSSVLSNLASGNASGLTNIDGGSLTNLVLSNASGVLAIGNGGTGGNTASNALVNLLPSYSGNGNKVLALNSNANNVQWVVMSGGTNGGGGGGGTVTSIDLSGGSTGLTFSGGPISSSGTITMAGTVAISAGGTGATNANAAIEALLPAYTNNADKMLTLNTNATALVWTTLELKSRVQSAGGINLATAYYGTTDWSTNADVEAGFAVGAGSISIGGGAAVGEYARTGDGFAGGKNSFSPGSGAAVGNAAYSTNDGGAVGYLADSRGGGFSGGKSSASVKGGAALGKSAEDYGGGGAVGWAAVVEPAASSATNGGGAVGAGAYAKTGFGGGSRAYADGAGAAVGENAEVVNGFAGGKNAEAFGTDNVQLGQGQNYDENSVQLYSAGTVDTNEWAAIAGISTYPTTNIQVTVVGGGTNTLVFTNGILMEVTIP